MLESQIQSKMKAYLIGQGYFVTKLIQTSTNGIPDLLAIKDGKAYFIEVKRPKVGIVSELQKYRIDELTKHGAVAFVCYSLDQLKQKLQ